MGEQALAWGYRTGEPVLAHSRPLFIGDTVQIIEASLFYRPASGLI
jgi:hypothetical protein